MATMMPQSTVSQSHLHPCVARVELDRHSLGIIFSYLTIQERTNKSRVSRAWLSGSCEPHAWYGSSYEVREDVVRLPERYRHFIRYLTINNLTPPYDNHSWYLNQRSYLHHFTGVIDLTINEPENHGLCKLHVTQFESLFGFLTSTPSTAKTTNGHHIRKIAPLKRLSLGECIITFPKACAIIFLHHRLAELEIFHSRCWNPPSASLLALQHNASNLRRLELPACDYKAELASIVSGFTKLDTLGCSSVLVALPPSITHLILTYPKDVSGLENSVTMSQHLRKIEITCHTISSDDLFHRHPLVARLLLIHLVATSFSLESLTWRVTHDPPSNISHRNSWVFYELFYYNHSHLKIETMILGEHGPDLLIMSRERKQRLVQDDDQTESLIVETNGLSLPATPSGSSSSTSFASPFPTLPPPETPGPIQFEQYLAAVSRLNGLPSSPMMLFHYLAQLTHIKDLRLCDIDFSDMVPQALAYLPSSQLRRFQLTPKRPNAEFMIASNFHLMWSSLARQKELAHLEIDLTHCTEKKMDGQCCLPIETGIDSILDCPVLSTLHLRSRDSSFGVVTATLLSQLPSLVVACIQSPKLIQLDQISQILTSNTLIELLIMDAPGPYDFDPPPNYGLAKLLLSHEDHCRSSVNGLIPSQILKTRIQQLVYGPVQSVVQKIQSSSNSLYEKVEKKVGKHCNIM